MNAEPLTLNPVQKRYFLHWLWLILAGEIAIGLLGNAAWVGFGVVAVVFLGALVMRATGTYPGHPEPLLLDFSSGLLAGVCCFIAWRFATGLPVNVLLPFVVVLPHFVYILRRPDLPEPGRKEGEGKGGGQ